MQREESVIVLEALLAGIPCRIGDFTFVLDTEFRLCVQGYNETNPDEHPLLVCNESFQGFVQLCNNASQYEIDVIAANLALNR